MTPAQVLMLIVPDDDQMEVEAWVANKDIGFIYEGQEAEIKVETFNFQKYGTLNAKLVEISRDAVEDKEKGLVYRALLRTGNDHFNLASGPHSVYQPRHGGYRRNQDQAEKDHRILYGSFR